MPSPRLLAVTALVALGGLAGAFGAGGEGSGGVEEAQRPTSNVRGGLVSKPADAVTAIAAENEREGTRTWRIPQARSNAKGLAAYAGATSASPGEQVPLYLRGKGVVKARAFRLGWYGGAGAHQVWKGTFPAQAQTGAAPDWQSSAALNTTGWPEGVYLIRLDLGEASRYVPLTVTSVRRTGAQGRVVVLTSPMTWAATSRSGAAQVGQRITLDRPLLTGSGGGALVSESGLIAQIERTGTDVLYLTDADLAAQPELVKGATAVLVAGQSRYWTKAMRTAVGSAAKSGTNLAFFGAQTAGVTATSDPADVRAFSSTAASLAGGRLTGANATCAAGGRTGLKVSDPLWWGFEGNRLEPGEVLPGLVGGRLDKVNAASTVRTIGSAELPCGDTQATSYRERRSGAAVFVAGTETWACTVSGACTDSQGRRVKADPRSQQVAALVTRNVVTAFSTPKAARQAR